MNETIITLGLLYVMLGTLCYWTLRHPYWGYPELRRSRVIALALLWPILFAKNAWWIFTRVGGK